MGLYLRPDRLEDALDALRAHRLTVLAGGTDFYPARVGRALDDDVLDVTALEGLRSVEDRGDHWVIGALTTWTDLVRARLPACFDGLKAAAREIGGPQVQNVATVAGNICNASPAADGVPNLLALDAIVELSSAEGVRALPIGEFILGNRKTARRPEELLTGITVPKPAPGSTGGFAKLGARKYLVISIVMVAAVIEPETVAGVGRVRSARIAVGACSPVARRLPALEAALRGRALDRTLAGALDERHLREQLSPICDVRGTATYRWDAAMTAIRRLLGELGDRLGGES